MAKLICDHYAIHAACWFCSHGAENHEKPFPPWKEPNKLCSDVHSCEVCASGVKCIEYKE